MSESPEALQTARYRPSAERFGSREVNTDWSIEELRSIRSAVLEHISKCTMQVFIDGLDELCEQDDQSELLADYR